MLQVQLEERPTEYTSIRIDYGPAVQIRKKKKKTQEPKPIDQTQVHLVLVYNTTKHNFVLEGSDAALQSERKFYPDNA